MAFKFGSTIIILTLVTIAGSIVVAALDGTLASRGTFFKVFAVLILGFTAFAVSTAFSHDQKKD